MRIGEPAFATDLPLAPPLRPATFAGPAELDAILSAAPESVSGLVERAGEFDLVALGRILGGNPAWVAHAAAGRVEAIAGYRKDHEDEYF